MTKSKLESVFHNSRPQLPYTCPAQIPRMTGGQKLDDFVTQHFSKMGERNLRTNRYKMKCNYCMPDAIIEHRELRCTVHLFKPEQCPNAPESDRKEALQRLATKRGALPSTSINELGTPSNLHVVEDGDTNNGDCGDGPPHKKGTRCIISRRLPRYYGKELFCNLRGRSRQFTIAPSNLGPGTPLTFCEAIRYSRRWNACR